jgi:hypothetical protein
MHGVDREGLFSVDKGVTYQATVTALAELALMLAVVVAYIGLARRHRVLWHPAAIVLAVGIVSIVVAVSGELIGRGWSGVPFMLRRSAIGGFSWGLLIAAIVWIGRRLFVVRAKPDR